MQTDKHRARQTHTHTGPEGQTQLLRLTQQC